MENLLRQFYDMCEHSWDLALIMHNFYQEAMEKTNGNGNYSSTFNPQVLAKIYHYGIGNIHQAIMGLESYELLEYEVLKYKDGITVNPLAPSWSIKNEWIETYKYTLNCENIKRKLSYHSPTFYTQEEGKIKHHNRRALELSHPGTLTIEQWLEILYYWNYTCAYCQGLYDVLEHFIPLTFANSGTTKYNCVPSCGRCNSLKGPYHPERMPEKIRRQFGERFKYVQSHLDELAMGE